MFRVTYKVMEGDNYAGGWGERTADIKSLTQLTRFKNIVSVYPMFIEIGTEQVTSTEIKNAIGYQKQKDKEQQAKTQVEIAEKHLARAKANLNKVQ